MARQARVVAVLDYPSPVPAKDPRPLVYGTLNLLFGVLYLYVFVAIAPSSSAWVTALQWAAIAAAFAAGASTLSRRPAGWRVSVVACATLLTFAGLVLVLVVASGAFLAGVYGGYGRASVVVSAMVCALVVELVAVVPALQLKYLLTRGGRRCFGLGVGT